DDRHVTREVDRSDRIGIVVDVRRMQTCFASIAPRPLWLGTDEAHASAVGVVVNLPTRTQNDVDVCASEELRCTMRAVEDANAPGTCELGLQACWKVSVEPCNWLRVHIGVSA